MRRVFLVFLLFSALLSSAQTFVQNENDSTVLTEYNDGKLWAYRHANDCSVGLTCYNEADDYGKYYQIRIFIRNLGDSSVTFCPEDVFSSLQRSKDSLELEVYTNEEFQKKVRRSQMWAMALQGLASGISSGMAGYTSSYTTAYTSQGRVYTAVTQHYDYNAANQARMAANRELMTLGQMMQEDRIAKEQGYLKKTTIHPGEAIVGYMNIKRKKGELLSVYIPVNNHVYSFDWNVLPQK